MYTFDNIRLLVTNFSECFRFYRDVLGLEVHAGAEDEDFASFGVDHHVDIGLYRRTIMAAALGTEGLPVEGGVGQDRFVIVIRVRDRKEVVEFLRGRGANFIHEQIDYGWIGNAAYLRDPDGNLLEFLAAPAGDGAGNETPV